MAAIVAVLATIFGTIFGTYTLIGATSFVQITIGIVSLGVAIYLLGYSPWL